MRSAWKGSFFKQKNNMFSNKSVILRSLFEKKVQIYNGKSLKSFFIKRGMLGLKIGEFVLTRKFGKLHKEKNISKSKK